MADSSPIEDPPLSVESTLPSADQRNAEKPWWCPICNYAVPRGHGGDHAPEHGRAAERFTAALDERDRLLRERDELALFVVAISDLDCPYLDPNCHCPSHEASRLLARLRAVPALDKGLIRERSDG